jgi:hypothetical protein
MILPDYFGRKHIGSIKGFATAVTVMASAFDPLASGLLLIFWMVIRKYF